MSLGIITVSNGVPSAGELLYPPSLQNNIDRIGFNVRTLAGDLAANNRRQRTGNRGWLLFSFHGFSSRFPARCAVSFALIFQP